MSVIYRSVFHHRAVQGLRNACSALPGLSACRLCLLLTGLEHTHEDKLLSSITHHQDYPMITPRSPESASDPGKASLHHSERQEHWITQWWRWWWWWWWWAHLLHLISLHSQTALHKLPAGWLRLPANLKCNVTLPSAETLSCSRSFAGYVQHCDQLKFIDLKSWNRQASQFDTLTKVIAVNAH